MPRRLDVHAHFVPDFYRAAAEAAGIHQPDGMPQWPKWSEAGALATMDRLDIATAMLSISSPGVHFGDNAAARDLARRVNEAGAALVRAHPRRFGLFASLPLPDRTGALAEVAYAFDELRADGIILQTNYHGLYLGDDQLEPLMAELNRRRAVVFVHPVAPPGVAQVSPGYPTPLLEFIFETTRSITHLLLQGVPARYPAIRWIIPHAGAALTDLVDRVLLQGPLMKLARTVPPAEVLAGLRGFYYDLAGEPLPRILPALRTLTAPDHLLYGSDYCFAPEPLLHTLQDLLDQALPPAEWPAVMTQNALPLFPRLAAQAG